MTSACFFQGTLLGDDELEGDVIIKTVIAGSSHAQSKMIVREATALYNMVSSQMLPKNFFYTFSGFFKEFARCISSVKKGRTS